MIVDTSALIVLLRNEPEADAFTDLLLSADETRISAGTLLETHIVASAHRAGDDLAEILELVNAEVVPFDARQADLAVQAFTKFGKGRHPAALNFGDCFAYALARAFDEPLLFKGNDFSRTDVRVAAPTVAH
jgi:ribonuclease VapC